MREEPATMKDIDVQDLRGSLRRSLQGMSREVADGSPPAGVEAALRRALETIELSYAPDRPFAIPSTSLQRVDLHDGPHDATSVKIRNALLRPLDWLDIGWKAAGVATAVPVLGAWTAVGLVLVIRDLLKLFSIRLTLVQGQVLHVLACSLRDGEPVLDVDTIANRLGRFYGAEFDADRVRKCLKELAKLKCVTLDDKFGSARLNEEVRL